MSLSEEMSASYSRFYDISLLYGHTPIFSQISWHFPGFFISHLLMLVLEWMICSYIVNVSLLLGGIISGGVTWPLISTKKGSWYPETLPDSSLHGLQGYRVNYNLVPLASKLLLCTTKCITQNWQRDNAGVYNHSSNSWGRPVQHLKGTWSHNRSLHIKVQE